MYDNNEVLMEHIEALRVSFELWAEKHNISVWDLTAIRNKSIEEHGSRYQCDWTDPEEKLAYDYFYCLEQKQRLEETHDLSNSIRLRLYWFVVKNPHILRLWDAMPQLDPKVFFNEQMRKDRAWKLKRDIYKVKKS